MASPDSTAPVTIETRGLGKLYEARDVSVRAVEGLDLKIREGEIFGLLGPNGAGKTTTIRMLCGLLEPTEGAAFVDGISMSSDPVRARGLVGLVPGEAGNLHILTAAEELAYHGAFYGLDRAAVAARSRPLLERLGLIDRVDERVDTFSKGMRRKLHLARALLHEPKILILDEPTSGLDPAIVEEVWDILRSLARDRNVTILFSSHQLEEVERLCDRVAIIQVKLLAMGTLSELDRRPPRYTVRLVQDAAPFAGDLGDLAGISGVESDGATLGFEVAPDRLQEAVPELVRRLVKAGADILEVEASDADLRSLYRSIISAPDAQEPS